MQSLSNLIFLRVAFLQFVTLLVTSLFSTLNKFSTVENLNKHLQYVIKYNKSIVFQKNDVGATLTADGLGVRIPKNRNILVITTGSTGNNSYAIGIFPNSEKNVSENCGFSFYTQSTSRITCSYVLDNTDTIYVRALTTKAPHTHPQYIINYLDKPENDIIVNCILLD